MKWGGDEGESRSAFRYTLKDGKLNMQDFEKSILGRKSSLELGREEGGARLEQL